MRLLFVLKEKKGYKREKQTHIYKYMKKMTLKKRNQAREKKQSQMDTIKRQRQTELELNTCLIIVCILYSLHTVQQYNSTIQYNTIVQQYNRAKYTTC